MNIKEDQIIGELVAQDYRSASVFKKYGIDFCCQGNRTISDACIPMKIDPQSVIKDLGSANQVQHSNATDFTSWPLDLLADYIEKIHHSYVKEKTIEIKPYLDKICRVHGEKHPELFEINKHFNATAEELAHHMIKEETIVFPQVKILLKAKKDGSTIEKPSFGTIQNPIQVMMDEHTAEGERFRLIAELSNNYTPPEDACSTYKVTFALLQEFEEDLHLHIHLENNILFPKAIELEKTMQ
ncbi:MAG: iron-sulfur cluster repair di-iron protein [Saprospiraceae bacterium]|nr:iron-sulfur cluster repair di-iron protein [Candidatus Brachybacter algidus]MBL0118068.1 iron-sulfur cluster repair di-iron protein [Candidatus Brachybacter algidus]